jgi:hypothetical protein
MLYYAKRERLYASAYNAGQVVPLAFKSMPWACTEAKEYDASETCGRASTKDVTPGAGRARASQS